MYFHLCKSFIIDDVNLKKTLENSTENDAQFHSPMAEYFVMFYHFCLFSNIDLFKRGKTKQKTNLTCEIIVQCWNKYQHVSEYGRHPLFQYDIARLWNNFAEKPQVVFIVNINILQYIVRRIY